MAVAGTHTRVEFAVTYEGVALTDGRMPVRDLAPALIALGDIFHEANAVLNPDAPPLDLEFRAIRDGSVRVLLDVAQQNPDVLQTAIGALASDAATAINNLVGLILGADGLFGLVRRIRGRRVERIERTSNIARVRLRDGETFEIPLGTALVYETPGIQGQTRLVLAPVKKQGIDRIRFDPPAAPPLTIEAAEVDAIDTAGGELTLVSDDTVDRVLPVRAIYFGGRSWMVSDGSSTFWARITDDNFLTAVEDARERFGNGDTLVCRLRIEQFVDDAGVPSTRHTIVQVVRHSPAARPLRLHLSDPDAPPELPPKE